MDTMEDTMSEAEAVVVAEAEAAILEGPSPHAGESIVSPIVTAPTPVLSATLPMIRTPQVQRSQTCKEAALQTVNDGVGR